MRKHWLNWSRTFSEESENFQLLVPMVLRKQVLKMCHHDVSAGHLGVNRTLDRVRTNLYLYRYKEDIRLHVSMCKSCSKASQPAKVPRAPLQQYRAGFPLDRVGIHIMGPMKVTKNGNKFILVIENYFTRWMDAYPLPNQKTEEVASKLVYEFICRFGIPFELHYGQG